MNDSLNGITAFVEAVEAGSFALAAERLRLTRSAVGKSIARLEQRLGVRLFLRTTRSQSLTDDGQAYYERCVRALAELDAGASALDQGRREPNGRLRVAVPVLFGRQCVAPVMRELARLYPRLNIEMSFSDHYVDLVEDGYDLAVRVGTIPDSATLVAKRLSTQRMVICAAPSYLEKHGTPETLDDLAKHDGIAYGRSGRIKQWIVHGADGQAVKPAIKPRMVFDDLQAITDAALAGTGLAWLPCWLMSKHCRHGELIAILDTDQVVAAEIYAAWPQTRYLPSKTRVAIDALVEQIPRIVEGFEAK